MSPDTTLCIFRRWRGGQKTVIALFPYDPHDYTGIYCSSYEHTGQHGGADPAGVIRRTRPASLGEPDVAALRRELESEPFRYRLEIRKKCPADAFRRRVDALAASAARARAARILANNT
jgi:hypothetical protein